jgi:hypothetical protein
VDKREQGAKIETGRPRRPRKAHKPCIVKGCEHSGTLQRRCPKHYAAFRRLETLVGSVPVAAQLDPEQITVGTSPAAAAYLTVYCCPECGGPPSDFSCNICNPQVRFVPVCAAPVVYMDSISDFLHAGPLLHRRLGTKPGRLVPAEEVAAL